MASLVQKLQLKPGQGLVVLNPPAGRLDRLTMELEGISVTTEAASLCDALLLFVNSLAEVERWTPDALSAVKSGGLLWLAYPKAVSGVPSDVNRDRLWEALRPTGWRPVRQVALDDTWSAMRFRPEAEVGR